MTLPCFGENRITERMRSPGPSSSPHSGHGHRRPPSVGPGRRVERSPAGARRPLPRAAAPCPRGFLRRAVRTRIRTTTAVTAARTVPARTPFISRASGPPRDSPGLPPSWPAGRAPPAAVTLPRCGPSCTRAPCSVAHQPSPSRAGTRSVPLFDSSRRTAVPGWNPRFGLAPGIGRLLRAAPSPTRRTVASARRSEALPSSPGLHGSWSFLRLPFRSI